MAPELYVNGDSVSVGFGLDMKHIDTARISEVGPGARDQRYSRLASRGLRLIEANCALRGCSGASIVRRTVGDLSARGPSWRGVVVIGWTSCFRSELRFDGRYVRMFFGADDYGGYEFANRYMFGNDVSANELRAAPYLELCRIISKHGCDMRYLAENWLHQVVLLQSFLLKNGIPYLFLPILSPGLSRSAIRVNRHLVRQVESNSFHRFEDALHGWSFVSECEDRGMPMFEHHPLKEGHEYIARTIVDYFESTGDLAKLRI